MARSNKSNRRYRQHTRNVLRTLKQVRDVVDDLMEIEDELPDFNHVQLARKEQQNVRPDPLSPSPG